MKKLIAILFVVSFLVSCKSSTVHGECVGFGKQKENREYELSTRNAIVAAIFIESIIIPVWWAMEFAYCPVGVKDEHEKL